MATAVAIVFLALVLKAPLFLHVPTEISLQGYDRVFRYTVNPLSHFMKQATYAYMGLSVLVIMAWALYVNHVSNDEKLFPRSNFFPALLVVLLSSYPLTAQVFSMPFVAHALVFVALAKTFQLPATTKPRRKSFDIGFLLALAALCYPPAIVFMPFFIFFLRIVRAIRVEEISAFMLGFLMPFYWYFAYALSVGKLASTLDALQAYTRFRPQPLPLKPLLALGIFYGIVWFYTLLRRNSAKWQPSAAAKKKWLVLRWFLLPSLACALCTNPFPGLAWMFVVSPFSLLCSLCFTNIREKYNTFAFYFMMAALLVMVWLL
ncbi:MAG: hypothetical protein FGM54_10845 [Chitinophagaceae bacterium]|nr:hypothetical protein [Chitinophagaceae bacterium]